VLKLFDSWRELSTFGLLISFMFTAAVLTLRETISSAHVYMLVIEITGLCAMLGINYTVPQMKALGKGATSIPVVPRGG
jgi:1,4-dihydroxy-2-naphthoate octaprenyltransferase